MKKIRCFFAAIALVATLLGGFSVQGMGSIANAASSQHASSQFAAGQLAARPYWPCPAPGTDC